jgi:hypothetical protein
MLLKDSVILAVVIRKDGDDQTDRYYVNPRRGKLIIVANGGKGGDGGSGENGRTITPKHTFGSSGGNGGNGGNGGVGGTIYVTFDSSALAYVNCPCIRYVNFGGMGGRAGSGGQGTGDWSSDGQWGVDGLIGADGPPVYITDPKGKTVAIGRATDPVPRP